MKKSSTTIAPIKKQSTGNAPVVLKRECIIFNHNKIDGRLADSVKNVLTSEVEKQKKQLQEKQQEEENQEMQ